MHNYILENNKIIESINLIVQESFIDLGNKISETLSVIEMDNIDNSCLLKDIMEINDIVAGRLDYILANHHRSITEECLKLEIYLAQKTP